MEIDLLADHQEVIPQLAQWFYAEWAYLNPSKTVADVEDALRRRLNTDMIPLVLAATTKICLDSEFASRTSPLSGAKHYRRIITDKRVIRRVVNSLVLFKMIEKTSGGRGVATVTFIKDTGEKFTINLCGEDPRLTFENPWGCDANIPPRFSQLINELFKDASVVK